MSWMFKLRGPVSPTQRFLCEIIGAIIFVCFWWVLSGIVQSSLVPHPSKVFTAFGDLYSENNLIQNLFLSIGLNLSGYTIALLLTIPIGFAIGLIPILRATFQRLIDAIRFLPLTAVPGIFIIAFGIGVPMKANFLAFGIFIFMLPVVVQRIDEVKDVYLKTVYTIGATNWQTIRSVYLPSVISRFFDDIRVLTAISWTYIVFAELIASQGGLGYLTFAARKQGRFDKLYALLLIFILIGIIQDKLFVRLDKEFFPFKYQTKNKYNTEADKVGLFDSILDFVGGALLWIFLATYFFLALNEFVPILGDIKVLDYLFGASVWSIHLLFLSILGYKLYNLYTKRIESQEQTLIADAGVSG